MNCREPDGLGFVTYACPDHPEQVCHIPRSCKSRFCSVCAKVQVDKWVADMNRLFPNCSYFHVTFTVPSQFRTLLFEKRGLLNAVFAAAAETLISFCKEQGFLPAVTAVLHTFGSDLKRHVHIHFISSRGAKTFWQGRTLLSIHEAQTTGPKGQNEICLCFNEKYLMGSLDPLPIQNASKTLSGPAHQTSKEANPQRHQR